MSHTVVVSFPAKPPQTTIRLLHLAATCVRNYRIKASCQLIGGEQTPAALLVLGDHDAVVTSSKKLLTVFERWKEPPPRIEPGRDALRWLAAKLPVRPANDPTSRVRALAALFHEQWQQDHNHRSGRKARLKKTSDAAWIERHRGTADVDIAATAFDGLPSDWQSENLLAAQAALELIDNSPNQDATNDDAFVEAAASIIHQRWLERNASSAPPAQRTDFAGLTAAEQHKDRIQIRLAIWFTEAWPASSTPRTL